MPDPQWTPSGVRLRLRHDRAGDVDWLLLPGGPGIGSESLHELADAIDLPGRCWLVDLPGDGSNVDAPGAPEDPYSGWPQVLLEAALAVERPVYIGHSTGGEYLLATPELAEHLAGLALVSTAPDASWMPVYEAMVAGDPLPAVERANDRYVSDPTPDNLRDLAVESAPWNFVGAAVQRGRELLARMPYNPDAVRWSADNFDRDYQLAWWPSTLPTLILSGAQDRIVTQTLWHDQRFHTANVLWHVIDGAGHFPWIEQPVAVRDAFAELAQRLTR